MSLDALEEMAGKSGGGLIEAAARVIAAGLAPAHPGLTAEKVLDLEAGIERAQRGGRRRSCGSRGCAGRRTAPGRS